ncbi:iron chelate uptake ABC transporter family permease subunit [Kineococcus sp. T90]|nr:iron chelate uptake ABC transporter family permease subunit [Kineococcus indalonis]
MRLGVVAALAVLALACYLLLFVRGSFEFAIERRLTTAGAMVVAAFTQGVATLLFQTVTQNRLLTPSIMGFDSVYVLAQTALVVVFGGGALAATDGPGKVLAQTLLMVAFATFLFRWLFSGRRADLHVLLLVGVALGMAFDSLSTFLQRVLSPADYDVLSVRLSGRLGTADAELLPWAVLACAVTGFVVLRRHARLDVLELGRDTAVNLGVDHRRELTLALVCVSVLVAVSTAVLGPMTFFGFLVAVLTRQVAGTHRHAVLLPMSFALGVLVLAGGQFVMEHVFYATGMLTVVLEFLGGAVFLVLLLRKGTL